MANSDFGIEEIVRTSFWRVHAVPIGRDGKLYTVDLQSSLLDNGNTRTQDKWVEFSRARLSQGDFGYLSTPHIRGLAHALRTNHPKAESKINAIREFLKTQFRKTYLMTSSRAIYTPDRNDEFVHEYGLLGEHRIKGIIVGPNEPIAETRNPKTYQALFETNDDIKEIDDDFKFLNGTPAFMWRINSIPKHVYECVVRLVANSDWFNLSCCYGDPQYSDSALGGRVFAEGDAPKI